MDQVIIDFVYQEGSDEAGCHGQDMIFIFPNNFVVGGTVTLKFSSFTI